ncbi:hypothetical protein HNP46_000516 [Pseudomonas nitritireducens]|uniref:Uncharacterized protein n=1 Tax=Pseudomonas nitroreducens TaxID=46680 RepID=A0A7W7KFT8_PSENT|nr:hypothetical protein [Pseudomonas nitritireducens]MBB4861705.1 hypothetical protein [Pseudomonas nitritireducens]
MIWNFFVVLARVIYQLAQLGGFLIVALLMPGWVMGQVGWEIVGYESMNESGRAVSHPTLLLAMINSMFVCAGGMFLFFVGLEMAKEHAAAKAKREAAGNS